jgi:NAD(P)-dependent dehydrogenase (short-subunit alcohol dehydrogenase family)
MKTSKPGRSLVTGGGRGLGLEFVRQLLQRGDTVLATARRPGRADALQRLASEHPGRLHVLALDVADSETFPAFQAAVASHVETLDLLINNAGALASGERFGQLREQDLLEAFRTNAVGPLLLTQALLPLLQPSATVLNISSILGSIARTGAFYTPSYAISKSALNMAGVLLSHALEDSGVRVLNLHPGWVRTDMGGAGASLDKDDAVRSILNTVDTLPKTATGVFVDRNGSPLPW